MTTLAFLLLLGYSAVNAFGAWAVIRRRRGTAMGFMAAAAALVIAAVAVAFAHRASVPFAVAGVLIASFVSYLDARAGGNRVVAWRHGARLVAGGLVAAAVVAARSSA